MPRRNAFDPFSPELLLVSVGLALGAWWLLRLRRATRLTPGTPQPGVDAQGRPIPPLPPVD